MSTAPQIVAAPIAIRNILFTTDFSAASASALPHALTVARQHSATVHVAHVIKPVVKYVGAEIPVVENTAESESRIEAWRSLDAFLTPERLEGIHCEAIVSEGALWECVSRLIRVYDIDLLILGTKGAGGVSKMVMGSDAEEIFHEAPCPVMTIGPHVKPGGELSSGKYCLPWISPSSRCEGIRMRSSSRPRAMVTLPCCTLYYRYQLNSEAAQWPNTKN